MSQGKQFEFVAHQKADSERLAAVIAERAQANTLLALDGDLGAGKTAFSQMVATMLGVEEVVNSPTFTIIKEYEGRSLPFFHMDVYRIDHQQAEQLGLDEYFFGGGVTMVEWASLIEAILPSDYMAIRIGRIFDEAYGDADERRRFTITPYGEPYTAWCEQWLASGLLNTIET